MALDLESFARLAELSFPNGSKIFPGSWCPVMDLFLVAVPLSTRERLTLWRMGGNKVWDVEVGKGDASKESILNVAWSPDGLQIALVHDPPRISIHSCHDGRETRSLNVGTPAENQLNGIWWLHNTTSPEPDGLTKLLRREGNVPGSAHSILQTLPLLDRQNEDIMPSRTLLGVAAANPSQNPSSTLSLPRELEIFPSLASNLRAASIAKTVPSTGPPKLSDPLPTHTANLEDEPSLESTLLVAADDAGMMYLFIEGSYPLGEIQLGDSTSVTSLDKTGDEPTLYTRVARRTSTCLQADVVHLPLLHSETLGKITKLSTSVRALLTYLFHALEEMRRAWFGTDTLEGGRDVGRKWIKVLQEKDKMFAASLRLHPVFELTNLLFTGKTTAPMREFLGGGGKLSERGMAQWQATVQGSLTVLQESAQRKVTPALERLVILLEEARGYSAWSQKYGAFQMDTTEIDLALASCHRGIELAEWLSKTAETEFERFHEFLKWMKAETSRMTDGGTAELKAPTYDPLEVAEYLEQGLLSSPLDSWFLGPTPQRSPTDLKPVESRTMAEVLGQARAVVEDPFKASRSAAPGFRQVTEMRHSPLDGLDRNLPALASELSARCASFFTRASGAVGRAAVVKGVSNQALELNKTRTGEEREFLIRHRTSPRSGEETNNMRREFIAVVHPQGPIEGEDSRLVIFRLDSRLSGDATVGVCAWKCSVEDNAESPNDVPFRILDAAFFDDETLLVVSRITETTMDKGDVGRAFLLSVPYHDADFELLYALDPAAAIEDQMGVVIRALESGSFSTKPMPIVRSRGLGCCESGVQARISVNGRENRRCACVLDESGQVGEVFDIDAEGDDDDEDTQTEKEEDEMEE